MTVEGSSMKRTRKMSEIQFILILVLLLGLGSCEDLQTKCSPELTKLMACLNYATAQADAPTSECCTSVSGIRGSDPECLCYIIQQASKGGATTKSLGLQISRLLLLPQACKLTNASVNDCPKLLGLSPSSPDNAIFANSTKATTTTASPTTGSTTVEPKSFGVMQQIQLGCTIAITAVSAIFISA